MKFSNVESSPRQSLHICSLRKSCMSPWRIPFSFLMWFFYDEPMPIRPLGCESPWRDPQSYPSGRLFYALLRWEHVHISFCMLPSRHYVLLNQAGVLSEEFGSKLLCLVFRRHRSNPDRVNIPLRWLRRPKHHLLPFILFRTTTNYQSRQLVIACYFQSG